MGNSQENRVESGDKHQPLVSLRIEKHVDVQACLHALAEKSRNDLMALKGGACSGITDQFNKPTFFDSQNPATGSPDRSQTVRELDALSEQSQKRISDARGSHGDAPTLRAPSSDSTADAGRLSELPWDERAWEAVVGIFEVLRDSFEDEKAVERVRENRVVRAAHEGLEQLAEKRITDPGQRKEFTDNMAKFEQRTSERENEYRKQFEAQGKSTDVSAKLAADKVQAEIVDTFKNVERLLVSDAKAPVSDEDRVFLAEQVMQHAADPFSIAQGVHDTCTVTTIETRTFTNDPAAAAKLVADVATTGKYSTNGSPSLTITLDRESLKKHDESKELPPAKRGDGNRDYASQLFQVTAANIGLEKRNASMHPPGRLRYEQHEPVAGSKVPDTGERLMDYSKKPPAEVKDKEGLVRSPDINSSWQIAEISKEISPEAKGGELAGAVAVDETGSHIVVSKLAGLRMYLAGIGNGDPIDVSDPHAIAKAREAVDKKTGIAPKHRHDIKRDLDQLEVELKAEREHGQPHVKSADELKKLIAKAKDEGRLPIIVTVETANNPFWSDSGGGTAGGSGGRHVVTITDYNPITGQLMMQNQWDRAASHPVDLEEFYRAMRLAGDNIATLQKDVDDNRRKGDVDYYKEYELLRLKRVNGDITDEAYKERLQQVAVEAFTRQYFNGADADDPVWKRSYALLIKLLEDTGDQKFVDGVFATFRLAQEAVDRARC